MLSGRPHAMARSGDECQAQNISGVTGLPFLAGSEGAHPYKTSTATHDEAILGTF